jgi:hypothetical protein
MARKVIYGCDQCGKETDEKGAAYWYDFSIVVTEPFEPGTLPADGLYCSLPCAQESAKKRDNGGKCSIELALEASHLRPGTAL